MDITGHTLIAPRHVAHRGDLYLEGVRARILASSSHKQDSALSRRASRHLLAAASSTPASPSSARVMDPVIIAVGAAVGAAARDESKIDYEISSNMKAVGAVLEEAQNLTSMSTVMSGVLDKPKTLPGAMGVGQAVNTSVTAASYASVLSDGNTTVHDQEVVPADDGREGIGVNDVGKDVTVPDPFADEAEAEKTLVTTYRRVGNASSIVALLAVSSIVFGSVWVMLLGSFTTVFVYATLFSLPMAFLASAGCLLMTGGNSQK